MFSRVLACVFCILLVTPSSANTEGDTNHDLKIDIVDLNNVRNNFGGTGLGFFGLVGPGPGDLRPRGHRRQLVKGDDVALERAPGAGLALGFAMRRRVGPVVVVVHGHLETH